MHVPALPARRIVRGAVGPLISWQPTDEDGEPADLGDTPGEVTVVVTTSDGTTVAGVGTVQGDGTDRPRTATLPSDAVEVVDWLTATWSFNGTETYVETLEVVGGTIGSIAELVVDAPNLAKQDDAKLLRARRYVEDVATRAMRRSPFPRFYHETLSGDGTPTMQLAWPNLLEIVWARTWSATTSTDLTASELAAIGFDDDGVIVRRDGQTWPAGVDNVEIGYRFGWRSIPHDLRGELHRAVVYRVGQMQATSIPDRATSMSTVDGIDYDLATPGVGGWTTGLPDVDEKLKGYRFRRPWEP